MARSALALAAVALVACFACAAAWEEAPHSPPATAHLDHDLHGMTEVRLRPSKHHPGDLRCPRPVPMTVMSVALWLQACLRLIALPSLTMHRMWEAQTPHGCYRNAHIPSLPPCALAI